MNYNQHIVDIATELGRSYPTIGITLLSIVSLYCLYIVIDGIWMFIEEYRDKR